MDRDERDASVRLAAFAFLAEQRQQHGDLLPRTVLQAGFRLGDRKIPLVSPQGIYTPAGLSVPLSITTVPSVSRRQRPYDDQVTDDGLILYRYRGTDRRHRDNVALESAARLGTPLIYFKGVLPGLYEAYAPVYVVDFDPDKLLFTVAADAEESIAVAIGLDPSTMARRRYITRLMRQRMHQVEFRARVIKAYRTSCAVCTLHAHPELLDAAHILPDSHPSGEPVISNGLSLCKLHHAAFDTNLIGVRPDYVVEVRRDLMDEADGPMLRHGLQGMHLRPLLLPRRPADKPNPDYLEERFATFRQSA